MLDFAFSNGRLTRHAAIVCVLVLAWLVAGCGGNRAMPNATDKDKAAVGLKTMLDKWKAGATMDSLEKETPAIHAADEDWEAGHKLVSYEVLPVTASGGLNARIPAVLEIESPTGVQRKNVEYLVETSPRLSIIRQD